MKRYYLALLLFILIGFSSAQSRHNYLALGGQILDDVGPYYFDGRNAYGLADRLAANLGASLSFDNVNNVLSFSLASNTAQIVVTSDVNYALAHRPQALYVNGQAQDSFLAIAAGGENYVPITPIIEALGGNSEFVSSSLTLHIDMPSPSELSASSAANSASTATAVQTPAIQTPAVQTPAPSNYQLAAPDIGIHDQYTRIAISIPEGTAYGVGVSAQQMLITLPNVPASAYGASGLSEHINAARYSLVEGLTSLVIDTSFAMSAGGQGYVIGLLPPTDTRPYERLFIDFGPTIQGQQVTTLAAPVTETALPQAQVSAPTPSTPNVNPTSAQRVVVIDAGHGGRDPGAQGYASEEVVVLAIALKLKAMLEQQGIAVILSRDGDYSLKDAKRDDLLARGNLATTEQNLFISIHANSVKDGRAHGIETIVFGNPLNAEMIALAIKENGGGAEGEAITQEIQNDFDSIYQEFFLEEQLILSRSLAGFLQSRMVSTTGAKDRGIKDASLAVLRNARTPAVLVEVGFVSHPTEGANLNTDDYQNLLAQALAAGISDFFNQGGSLANY